MVPRHVPPVLLADTPLLILHLVQTVPPELLRCYQVQHPVIAVFLVIHLQRDPHHASNVWLERMLIIR